jgi:D-amino-acid oxidase
MFDVAVVGAGVVGLSSALRLLEHGARVVVVAPEDPADTVSWVAAAVWYPTHTDADPRILAWSGHTYDALREQAGQGVPGVVMRQTRMLLRGSTATPWWAAPVPDFRLGPAGEPYTGQWQFTVPAVEMGLYLPWLLEQVQAAGGIVQRRSLARLDELGDVAPVVVNATGLAAGALVPDPAVHPIRGRIVLVRNPGLTTSWRDEDDPAGQTYIHPRSRDVVLGGTFEPGESDRSPDREVSRAIIERCVAIEPALEGAEVIEEKAGLRPGRHGGPRVEADPADPALIHNYGHGGAGVTLSWGCADEVVRLFDLSGHGPSRSWAEGLPGEE